MGSPNDDSSMLFLKLLIRSELREAAATEREKHRLQSCTFQTLRLPFLDLSNVSEIQAAASMSKMIVFYFEFAF